LVEVICLHLFVSADCKDGGEDAECNNIAATNSILLSLLTDRLKKIHDIELPLCDHDAAHIVKLLCSRNSNNTDYVLPPSVPTRFRCYVRTLTSSHLFLTVVPATYDDMIAIMSTLDSVASVVDSADDSATRLSEDKNFEAVTESLVCSRIPADQALDTSKNVTESSVDVKNSSCQANAEVDTSTQNVDVATDEHVTTNRLHNIRLPVFVFDCLLNSISDQLVQHSSSDRPPDIVEDFTYQVMVAVSNQVNM